MGCILEGGGCGAFVRLIFELGFLSREVSMGTLLEFMATLLTFLILLIDWEAEYIYIAELEEGFKSKIPDLTCSSAWLPV